ncbi:MAG: RDD family protein, partial [Actinomadura rubrobrunea]|nr:RDD family protein [Actinomadura rubrobrunea]
PGYGQPAPQPGYGQPPMPPAPPAPPAYGQPAQPAYQEVHHHYYGSSGQLATWGSRFAAYLIDYLIIIVPFAVLYILGGVLGASGSGGTAVLGVLFFLLAWLVFLAGALWLAYQEGTTGQTIGKRQMGIKVISAQTGQPVGFGWGVLRRLCHHTIDGAICYLGFLWPLWDDKRQTFGDKICNTYVVRA